MTDPTRVVVIGGSAGSIDVVLELLSALPPSYPLAVAMVIHVLPTARSHLAELFATRSGFPVREAEDKAPLVPGVAVLAPPDYHLLVEHAGAVALSRDPLVHFSRPSIDVLFESAANALGAAAAGILVSGANHDGAAGLCRIVDAGGRCAVQDPATASASEMPRAAIAACRPELIGAPTRLARWLRELPHQLAGVPT